MLEHAPHELKQLVELARDIKTGEARERAAMALRGRLLTMLFFNPSLRTRTSMEAAMCRFGGQAITLSVGGDTWKLEARSGVRMDGDAAEHVKEAAPVLSRYCDVLGVRTFAGLKDAGEDANEPVLRSFVEHATVPVINLESAVEHPCQGLADWLTIEEKLRSPRGKRIAITWAPQVKGLPLAVPHSALLAAAAAGMNIALVHPPIYDLSRRFVDTARRWSELGGGSLTVTSEQRDATRNADVVYVKSWGSAAYYGDVAAQQESFREHAEWMVEPGHLGPKTLLMHCLPVRRNVVISDAALDDPRCIVVDQAENRLWAQAAILTALLERRG